MRLPIYFVLQVPEILMVNENYSPTEDEEEVLSVLKAGRDGGEPWGRANRVWISEQTGLNKGTAEYSIRNLLHAGWLRRPARGLYEFVEDPRE